MRCRAFQNTVCEGDGIFACYNESCAKRDECWSNIMIDDDLTLTCQLKAHPPEINHEIRMEDALTETEVTIGWPSRDYKNE